MIEDPEIDRLRQEIDRIDHAILAQLRRRAEIVLSVGDRKRERGLAVYDPSRERALLRRLSEEAQAPLDPMAVISVFESLVEQCRRLEDEHVARTEGARAEGALADIARRAKD